MENCLSVYTRHVLEGTHYAYRLTKPERCTVLLIRRNNDWYPIEIRTAKNGYAKADTVHKINTWLGTENGEEDNNDYPF